MASRAVSVTVAIPPDGIGFDGDTAIVDCERLNGTETTLTVAAEVTAWPPIVAVIVSLPTLVPAVNVAV